MPPWRDGGQARFLDRPVPTGVASALRLHDLAAHAGISLRGFARHFRAGLGTGASLRQHFRAQIGGAVGVSA